MNEELMRELVSILRAMKEGSPAAWDTLVAQRATYCFACAGGYIVAALIFVVCGICMHRSANYYEAKGDKDATGFCGVCALLGYAIAAVSLFLSFPSIAEGLAPLGRVLEVLR